MNTWPVLRSYDVSHLRRIAMPLGGIGTGAVSLGGRGDLRDWEIMNRPAKGFVPVIGRQCGPFFAVWVDGQELAPCARLLEGPLDVSEYDGHSGSTTPNHGLPRFREARFDVAYPLAQVSLRDPDVPVRVRLEAFNPLVAADADASAWPMAVLRYVVENPTGTDRAVSICGSLPNFVGVDGSRLDPKWSEPRPVGAEGNRNAFRESAGVRGIFMDSEGVDATDPAWGSLALASLDEGDLSCREAWADDVRWGEAALDFWDDFSDDGRVDPRDRGSSAMPFGSVCMQKVVPAGGAVAFRFLLTWHFPNRITWTPKQGGGCACDDGSSPDIIGNHYCTRFGDAWAVAEQAAAELDALEERTVAFVRSVAECDLPHEIREAALFNVSTLRSQTCFRTPDGRFFGFEGCCDGRGCCHGSCTHVWNYEQATAFLFGELSRGMRETEFAQATDAEGCMSFRVNLPIERAREHGKAAADGQMGCLMKLYRDWRLSGDDAFLRSLWPHARRALEFCWIPGGWDADRDGVMEGCQHNTMDVEYYGPNPQMTGWYLGALRAAEEMARHLDESDFADACARLFASGRAWMDAHLFNGEYYEHEIRIPEAPDAIPPSLRIGLGGETTKVEYQLGAGCLVDQLVGQTMAHVCGLGYLHDPEQVRTTLQSIYRHNRRIGFHGHFNPMRSYVLGDETALLMASYPHGHRPKNPFPYFGEVMTGFEYTAAVGMLYEGEESDALQCIRDIRARYDGAKRNPFDEAECGRHYARAMASWAAVPAWTGFRYDGVEKTLHLAPREGRYCWSTGDAWGTYTLAQTEGGWSLRLAATEGSLPVTSVLVGDAALDPGQVVASGAGGRT
ncbi:MAG: GH116 family glycosyl-hydrolase [Planctomycetota bacterium]